METSGYQIDNLFTILVEKSHNFCLKSEILQFYYHQHFQTFKYFQSEVILTDYKPVCHLRGHFPMSSRF